MKMKVAIGIPAYKAQKTIEECLSSINIQSFRDNIDVIISPDNPWCLYLGNNILEMVLD